MALADERAHALLAPSAAHRWLNCPGSVRASEQIPDETSIYAEEGSLAHEFCALRACEAFKLPYDGKKLTKAKYNGTLKLFRAHELYSPEMEDYATEYVQFIASLPPRDLTFIEQEVNMEGYAPDCWGTSDCIAVYDNVLHVIDFKYGKGVKVDAKHNEQMMLYALGAFEYVAPFVDVNTVKMSIFQPRIGNVTTAEMTLDDLMLWGNSIDARAHQAYEGTQSFLCGSWCKFCKIKKYCRHYANGVVSATEADKAKYKDGLMLNADELGEMYFRALACESYIKEVKSTCEEMLLAGTPIKGLKLVEGRSKRIWTDEAEAIKALEAEGVQVYKEPELISLAQFEKILGAKKFDALVGKFVTKSSGAPTVTGENDPRKEWQPYADDFSDIEPQV